MAAKKVKGIRLKTYEIIYRAIEESIPGGINRYLKYRDLDAITSPDVLAIEIQNNVMLGLNEVIDFDEED